MRYPYVIVGAGMAADAAIKGIRRHDRQGAILVLGAELYPPYQRPLLSKRLWLDARMESIWVAGVHSPHVRILPNIRAARLDTKSQQVITDGGEVFEYDKLLIATGREPRRLGENIPGVYYVGTLGEHIRLYQALQEEAKHVLVIGGGFIGSEMASVLSQRGHRITWVMPESAPYDGVMPSSLTNFLTTLYQEHHVELITKRQVENIQSQGSSVQAVLDHNDVQSADLAVVGIGGIPSTQWLGGTGLSTERGVLVDQYLQTADPHVFAAGDIALVGEGASPMLHEDHAVTQGRLAGENMAGAHRPYTHVPFFYSDIFQYGYEAIGDCRTVYETLEDWVQPYEEGVIYYLQDGHVKGVLNWNVWDGIAKARTLLSSTEPMSPDQLKGQIRNAEPE